MGLLSVMKILIMFLCTHPQLITNSYIYVVQIHPKAVVVRWLIKFVNLIIKYFKQTYQEGFYLKAPKLKSKLIMPKE